MQFLNPTNGRYEGLDHLIPLTNEDRTKALLLHVETRMPGVYVSDTDASRFEALCLTVLRVAQQEIEVKALAAVRKRINEWVTLAGQDRDSVWHLHAAAGTVLLADIQEAMKSNAE
jgi:hypothetical protein